MPKDKRTTRYLQDKKLQSTHITESGLLMLRELRGMMNERSPLVLEMAVARMLQFERERRGLYPTTITPR